MYLGTCYIYDSLLQNLILRNVARFDRRPYTFQVFVLKYRGKIISAQKLMVSLCRIVLISWYHTITHRSFLAYYLLYCLFSIGNRTIVRKTLTRVLDWYMDINMTMKTSLSILIAVLYLKFLRHVAKF